LDIPGDVVADFFKIDLGLQLKTTCIISCAAPRPTWNICVQAVRAKLPRKASPGGEAFFDFDLHRPKAKVRVAALARKTERVAHHLNGTGITPTVHLLAL
jgi:hypothetical protein